MRVTNNITRNTFVKNNRRMRTNMLGSYTRIMTQRRFNRVSEDTVNGTKAMTIRRHLRDLDIYDSNLSSVKQLFNEAEKSLTQVAHDCYIAVEEQLVAATNGTHDQMEMNIFATALDQIAEQMVDAMNTDFGERQIFGGTNNGSTAFGIGRYCVSDDAGKIVYPPYYYDYYVGAETTQKQTDDANDALDALAECNKNGTKPTDSEFRNYCDALRKMNISVSVTEDGKYSAFTTVQNSSKNISLLDLSGNRQELTCTVADGDPAEVTLSVNDTTISTQKENEVKHGLTMVDVPRCITYNGIPVDFDVTSKMLNPLDPDNKDEDQMIEITGGPYTVKKLNDLTYEWNDGTEINPDIDAAKNGRDNSLLFPGSGPIYVDIGLGIKYDDNYDIDPQTAMNVAFNGAKIMGCGLDSEKYSKNLAQLVLDAARALKNGDQATTNAIIDKANNANRNVLIEISNLGSKYNNIEFYQSKNEDSRYNLRERQNIVEGTDMEYEISYWENLKAAYDASLKVGTQIIPHSIFDFI